MKEIRLGGLKKLAWIGVVVVLALSTILAFQVPKVGFDYDFEKFYPADDPETKFFEEHRNLFESDNDFIFISLKRSDGVFDKGFLQRTSDFVDSLRQDRDVRDIQCLTSLNEVVKKSKKEFAKDLRSNAFSPRYKFVPYLNPDDPDSFKEDSVRIFQRPELVNSFISEKGDALLVWIKHTEFMPKSECDSLKARLDALIAHYEFDDFKYAGRTIGVGYYVDQMQFETVQFIGLSFILVIIFLIISFRSIWGVVIPLTVVTMAMLWIVGFMGLVDQPINLVLTVLPSIIFVVAMSDVMHLVSKYFDELRRGADRADALKVAYKEVGFATLLTSVTTAMGFLTLLSINMTPIRNFGIYTAIGVILAFFLAYTLLPGLLVLIKPPKVAYKPSRRNLWFKFLHGSFVQVLRRRRAIFFGFLGIIAISLVGFYQLESNYFLLEDLKEDSPLRQDYDYFDSELMGLRPFELAISVKKEGALITDYDVLTEVNKVEEYLTTDYGLSQTLSIISALKIANRTEHGGDPTFHKFPNEKEATKYIAALEEFDSGGQLSLYMDSTKTRGRISSTLGDEGLYEMRDRNVDLAKFLEENVNTDLVEFQLTGTGHLLDKNMSSLSLKLMLGLLLAVGMVSLLMGILYRSIKIVLIALVPNILPMLMLAAILGFSGINLTVSTAVIFTISFGIAVDDTIHFMSKFKIELNKGRSFLYALKRTYLSTGRAIILTTLILCSGFLLLMMSDFLGTFYIGLLISCTLFFALFSDLFFLPVLMLYFYKKKGK